MSTTDVNGETQKTPSSRDPGAYVANSTDILHKASALVSCFETMRLGV